jgi:hypothetical protein
LQQRQSALDSGGHARHAMSQQGEFIFQHHCDQQFIFDEHYTHTRPPRVIYKLHFFVRFQLDKYAECSVRCVLRMYAVELS